MDEGAEAEDADFLNGAGGQEFKRDIGGAVEEDDLGCGFLHEEAEVIECGWGRGLEEIGGVFGESEGAVGDADEFYFGGLREGADGVEPFVLDGIEAQDGEADGHFWLNG